MATNLNEVDDFEDGDEKTLIGQEGNVSDPAVDSNPLVDGGQADTEDSILDDNDTETDEDVVTTLLRNKGINPDSVKFQNEKGEIEEIAFKNLSREEQLQILGDEDVEDKYGLNSNEIQLINQLRSNNLSVNDYNNYIARQAVQQYIDQNSQEPIYQVDTLSDDELYILDLKARIPDLSDDEALSKIEKAKENSELYTKEITSLREEYKQREDNIINQEQLELMEQQAQQSREFENVIVDTIQNNDSIDLGDSSLDLSDDDKNQLASFILDSDGTGTRYIAKALNDPKTLVKMAWYALKGEEAFGQIQDYYKQKISEVAKYNYNKGYLDYKSGKAPNSAKAVVRKKVATGGNKHLNINDLD